MATIKLTDQEIRLIMNMRTLIAAQPTKVDLALAAPAPVKTWASKKDRAAGNGFPCIVPGADNCGRRDLRTPESGVSHDETQPKYHFANKVR